MPEIQDSPSQKNDQVCLRFFVVFMSLMQNLAPQRKLAKLPFGNLQRPLLRPITLKALKEDVCQGHIAFKSFTFSHRKYNPLFFEYMDSHLQALK